METIIFSKIFVGSANRENARTLLHDAEEEKFFYFTEKKYIDFALKE